MPSEASVQCSCFICEKIGDGTEIQWCSHCKDHFYCSTWLLFLACNQYPHPTTFLAQAGPARLLTGPPTSLCVKARVRVLCGMTNTANVRMEAFTKENWNLSLGHPDLKEWAGDIVSLRSQMIFVKSLRSHLVVMRLRCLTIGLKGSDGLAVEQMLG